MSTALSIKDFKSIAKPKRSKFGNVKTVVDGITFDSKSEAKRWGMLHAFQSVGMVSAIRRQVRFPLIVNDILIATYVADFIYRDADTGAEIVEDVKSDFTRKDPLYRVKKNLMIACHGISIREVIL